MAHKTKDKPRKLYARQGVPFICYATAGAPYWAPELRSDSAIKLENGPVTVTDIVEGEGDDAKVVGIQMTQGDVTETATPFTFERKQRGKSAEASEAPALTSENADEVAA